MAAGKRKTKKSSSTDPEPSKSVQRSDHEEPESDGAEESDDTDDGLTIQVNNSSLSELKNALDDATKTYLNTKIGFSQNRLYEDLKLGLGWLASLLAGGISLAGWYYGWEKTQAITGYFVAAYVAISATLTVFLATCEKQIIYMGKRPSKKDKTSFEHVTISTDVKGYEPIYRLNLVYQIERKAGQPKKFQIDLQPPFKDYFDVDGYLDEPKWDKYLDQILRNAAAKV